MKTLSTLLLCTVYPVKFRIANYFIGATIFLATSFPHLGGQRGAAQSLQWAKSIGSNVGDMGYSITTDGSGNVYVTGYFSNTADFDPGPGTANLISVGAEDIFIAKYDAIGNYIWAKNIGSTGYDGARSIAVDDSGYVYITGDFRGTADFDPGPGTTNFTPIGVSGGFLAKYSASGNYLWAIIIDSPGDDRGYKITIDDSNKVFITGFFQGTTDFDPSAGIANLTIVGGYDIFVAKYDANGNYLWAKSIGSANTDFGYSIAVDDSVNVYTTGVFNGTADFDPGVGTYNLTSAGSPDIFISKLDALGNFVWAKKIGGTSGDESFSITTDTSGNIYSTGYFQGTVDFDPGTGTYNLTATGLEDIFISKLDASGNFLWAKAMGGTSSDEGFSITTDWSGNVYTTGYFEGTADFDPGTGQYNLTATNNNIFISKLDSSGNFFWAIAMGGAFSERGLSLATDGMGNVYTMGYFQGTADFDPDTSVADTTNLISAGSNDIFFAKYSQPPPCGSFTSTTTITNASCYECTNGSVSINVQGGGFPFIYSWSTGLTDTSVFNQYDLNNVGAGGYSVTVTEAGGCTVTANTFVTQPSPLTTFIKNFGGTGDDGASNIAATADGGYLLAGHAVSFGAGQTDVYLVKTDAAGNVQWSKTIGDVLWEWAHDIHQTSDGGYIITGEAGNTPPNDVFLIKTDSLGNVQWSTVYGDSLDEKGHAVRQTSDGGYIIAGETYTYGSGQNDLFLIKTGSTGVVQWSKAYGSTNYDYAKDVIETPGGGFVVAGSTRGYGAGSYDVYLLKTDINGNLLWTKTYGTSEDERGHSLQKTLDGGYAITGYSLDLSSGYSDVYFVKTDSNGVLQWDRLYGDALDERGESFVQTGDSGYFIAGYTYSFGAGGSDVYMLRTNAQGAQQWSNAIGGPLDDAGYEIIQSPDGGFAVAGLTLNNSAGSYDMRLIKTDELGTTPCNNQSVFTIENNPPDSTSTGGSLSIVSVFGNSSILTETSPATIDSLSCIFQCNLTISAALTAVSCNGSSDGSVTLIITGGTPPYEYFWNTGASNDTLTGLSAGTYYVTVSDLLSCLATDTIVVNVYKAGAWSQKAVLGDTARAGGVGFSIGTKGYIGTGRDTAFNDLKDFWEWDQATNVWTQKANFGGTARYAAVGFSIGAKGYIGTGTDIASVIKQDFWEWDQAGNTWTQKSDTSGLLRFNGVGFSIGAKGYIGTGNDGVRKQDFWEWNQATDTWTKKTNFGGTAREYAVGFSIGAKGFIGTGYDGIAPYKQDFWEWNQATDIWTPKANFSGGARDVAVGFSIGAKGYIGTGYDGVAKKDFWEWDQAGNTWTQKAGFGGTARYYAVGFSIGTKGYIGTGLDSAYTKDFWEFNPDTIFTLSFAKTDLSCFADTNGTATVIPAGGLTPYTYLWSTLSGFETLTGLSAGNYAVTVTDARGCTLSGNTTITAPPYIATYTDTVAKILFDERNCRQYPIEKIGNQWWMTENLNVGTQINSTAGGQLQTNNSIIEKYCYDNNPANCTTYGGLYEWGEAMNYAPSDSGNPGTTQGVCPTGWRLPTDAEWCELENFIDPTTDPACNLTGYLGTDIGTKLKDNISWDGTNASGFFALPAGIRHFDGSFINPGMNEDFWSATELSGADAWLRGLFTGNPGSDRINGDKAYGFSVRCLQDFVPPLTISISSTNITCNGDSSGSATVTASGGVTPYSYLWSTLSGFQTLTGLSAGNYTVTVTDAASNTATDSVTITQPPYTATYTDTVAKILFDERNCKQYPIEKIGNQWWMKENLNVGTQINSTTGGQLQTDNGILEKYCYNNNPANCATYGGLYEWGEAMGYASSDNGNPGTTQGVCPTGWRLPTDYEWCEMENFIDPTTDPVCNLPSWRGTDIGTKLKDDVSWNGTNTSGFSALPAGYRNYSNGSFSNLNLNALLWSATVASGTYAWDRVLSTGNSQSNHDTSGKTNGFSVRCLRDIDSFDSLTVSISSTNVNCNGDSSGSATVTASGGVTPYSYLWSTLSGFQTLTGLSAGNYTVTVTDAASNTITDSVTITEPAYIATYTDTVAKILFDERNCKQYPIEKIGSQWWMTENLNVGTQINSTAGGQLQTNNSIIEKYCYDNNPANCTTYGGLYEWGEAMNYATSDNGNPGTTQGVCPTGWRLPTDAEWCEMENFIDPTTDPGCNTTGLRGTDAGTKLKDNNSWNGTNTNGFTALPAGSRDFSDGSFYNLGSSANFWSATEDAGTTAWYRILTTGFSQSIRNPLEKPSGCSVRCLQDIIPPLTISVSSTNVSCNGDSTGSVTVTASGGVTPYSYLWSTLSGFQTLTGLSAGNYTVTVTDAASATATDSVTITQSAFIATYTDTVAKILFDERNCRQYPIEKISNQWWMTENLNVGTQINSTTGGQLQTNNSILEKYCYNNNSAYCDTFGALYEWNEAMGYAASDSGNPGITQGVCPTGWRLPTDAEWCELENLIDVTTDPACNLTGNRGIDVGTKLKDNISWSGTNSSGFSALPAGNRNYSNGSLNSLGSDAQFWSATENGGTIAWVRALYTGSSQSYRDNYNKTYGFSVRCLQDVVPPLTISISSTNVACNGDSSGSATVTTSGGTPPYTYLWNTVPPSGGQGVTGLQAGTYTVTVTDAASNTATDSVTITQPPALAITTFNPTFITCNGDSDGGMNPGYFGGTPPYTYLWSNGDTTGAITNLTAGTYTFTITDANGCTFWDFMYLPDPPLISVSTVSSDVSCYGGSDGTITATVSGGTPPYTYNWSNMQTDSVATGLAINSYSVIVNDTNGCSVLAYDTIREPSFFTIQGTSVNGVSCFGGNDGAIDITVTGGVTPYSYLWSTGYTGEDISGLDTGWYDVTVTDANGCNAGAGNSINQPALLTISVSSTGASCSGVNDGSATVTASGGVQPYDYLWSNGNTNSVAAAVAGGSYSVTVSDLNGCTIVDSVTINNLASLTISFTVSNTTCGAANGSAAAFVSGGQTPYTYYWSNTQTGPLATGLASGLITCTVTDNVGCIIVDSTMINTITPPSVNIIFTSPSCSGSSDGTAVATVAGGSPPYAYQWSNLSGFQNLSGLSAGNFSVTVTDSLGCMATDNIVLTSPPLLTVSVSSTDVTTCGGNDGTAAAAAAGGSGNYTYQWSNGLTTSAVSGLSAGTYTVIVYDANGCAESDIAVVNGYSGTLSVTITKTDVSCYGGDDGTVDVAASGGSAPYTYLWSNLSGFQNLTGLSAGNYTVTVTDASGCIGTGTAVITEPAQISVSFQNITNPSCGFSDGSAMAVPSGGTPPYEFIWTNNDTVAAATDLDAGIHSVIVTDANGCIEYGILSLSNTGGMSISSTKTDINCSGEMNGTAAVTVTGGSQPYTYNWSGGETTSTLSGLSEGIYEVIVFDNDSCIAAASVAITAPDLLTVNVTKEDASCGIPDGAAAVAVAGGAPPYYYSWSTGSTGASESGLPAGLYFVAVTDNSGCLTTKSVAINNIGAPEIEVLSMNNTGCGMTSSGAIDIGVTGGAGGYSYQWNDSSTTQDITGLSEGEYAVTVSDSAGCVSIEHVIIESAMPAVQPICMVTVDSLTGKNLVVWDKSLVAPDISDFRIYKEGSASGVYNLIATVPYSDQSEYRDMAANPLQRSWRYRITAVDSCGNESEFSEIHKTMHLAINLGLGNKINLIWDPYEGFNYTTFVIYRGTNPNQIDSLDALPSTLHSYTDLNPPQTPNLYYIVSALYPGECTVQKMAKKYNSSKSNTAAQQMPIGIEELRISDCQNCGFRIYPNPANEYFTLEIYACLPDRQGNKEIFFTIYDILGRKVFKSEIRNPKSEIIIKDLPAGLYFYEVKNKDGVLGMGKLVIE